MSVTENAPAIHRTVLLASPRSFCAGVERAIAVVEQLLDQRGGPIYMRKQIVHNIHVVAELEAHGAVFVDELEDVPPGATVVFSAHGVSPAVRVEAAGRGLEVIDATCPLVTKVHAEARRFAARGDTVVLIGPGPSLYPAASGDVFEQLVGEPGPVQTHQQPTPVAARQPGHRQVEQGDVIGGAVRGRVARARVDHQHIVGVVTGRQVRRSSRHRPCRWAGRSPCPRRRTQPRRPGPPP